MRPEEELFKRKKKKSRGFVKFVFILIFIIILASIVFYNFENPSFLINVKNKLVSFYNASEESTDTVNPAESLDNESGQTQEENISQDSDEELTGKSEESVKNISLWQKIINFFKERMASEEEKFPAKLKIRFYFATLGQEEKFIYEERAISAGDPRIAVENAMKELLKGPAKSYHYPVIPPGTKLISVEIYENLAKINLSQEFLENSLDSGILDEYVIYTIVNTITEIPEVEGVIFLIEGKRIKFYGSVDLSIPAIRDENYL